MSLGECFQRMVGLLYRRPTAQVLVNGVLSSPFPIRRGTRQGCPLSPLLFALAIEPLARSIRMDAQMEGWSRGDGSEDRIALYVDDLLLFLADPQVTGPRCMKLLRLYEDASGLKVNEHKSVLVPIRGQAGGSEWGANIPIRRII